jgi:hypothetical protein
LKAHETDEESVVRPVSSETAGADVAEARNAEEKEAIEVIAALSKLDVESAECDSQFAEFKQAVSDHAEAEEHDEFPSIEFDRDEHERQQLDEKFLAEFQYAGGKR